MNKIPEKKLVAYRAQTFRLTQGLQLSSPTDAVEYVNERGFVYFWPIKDVLLPSLWTAVAGDRPVANAHDDPGHVTWGWKDNLLDKKKWYYGKILRGKASMISLEIAPYFYALSENYGDPEEDYLILYRDGLLSQPAKLIFETLLDQGAMDTVTLRKKIHMTSKASNSPFDRTLVELQKDFKILPVGVARTGGWRYSFIYDLVHRYFPEIPETARYIPEGEARAKLATVYFNSAGALTERDLKRLFQWPTRAVKLVLKKLVESGDIFGGFEIKGEKGEGFVVRDLAKTINDT
jgi:hypothetical protein